MEDNVDSNSNIDSTQPAAVAPDWVLYSVAGLLFFLFGLGGSFVFSSWNTISGLFYEASLVRYETMTGDRGPATYLVFHDGVLEDLQALAAVSDDILGVEQDELSNVAKIAFTGSDVPSIAAVEKFPGVESMMRRNVPMICH